MIIKNEDIDSVLLAVPEGHRHLRLALKTKDGKKVVLQEAAVAAIVRAYVTVKTHPQMRAIKLTSARPEASEGRLCGRPAYRVRGGRGGD